MYELAAGVQYQETAEGADTGGVKTANIIDVDPSLMKDKNGAQIEPNEYPKIRQWVLDRFMPVNAEGKREGVKVTIKDDGTLQVFTRGGLEGSNKRKREPHHNEMYVALDKLIENAVFDHFEPADAKHPGLKGQNVYYAAARIGTDHYAVTIKIDISRYEQIQPAYKDHKVADIKIAPSLYRGYETTQKKGAMDAEPNQSSGDTVSLSLLKGNVKPSGGNSQENTDILFQTEAGLAADAGLFDTKEEFRDYLKAMYLESELEGIGGYSAADEAWADAFWEGARAKARSDTLADPLIEGQRLTVAEANEAAIKELSDPATLREFLKAGGEWLKNQREALSYGFQSDAEQAEFERIQTLLDTSFTGSWKPSMLRAASRDAPTAAAPFSVDPKKAAAIEKRFISTVRNSPDDFREAYGLIMGRPELADVEGRTRRDEVAVRAKGTPYETAVQNASGAELKRLEARLNSDEIGMNLGKITTADPVKVADFLLFHVKLF